VHAEDPRRRGFSERVLKEGACRRHARLRVACYIGLRYWMRRGWKRFRCS
jgi:hypothetical protein